MQNPIVDGEEIEIPETLRTYVKQNQVQVTPELLTLEDGTGVVVKSEETEDGAWLLMEMLGSKRLVLFYSDSGQFPNIETQTFH